LSYLRVLQNPRAELDMLRLLNIPPRGLGEQTVVALQDFCREKKLSLREGLAQATFIPSLGHSTKEALKAFDSLLNELSLEIKTQTVTSLIVKVLQKTGL
ncbi:MAG: ATP-dependent DNA helicase PcrA, partial [candidate division KSB1 bacterium]|nr:ATP-dependent DNA helicase PcrA [candidate division KSB1 bacterium]